MRSLLSAFGATATASYRLSLSAAIATAMLLLASCTSSRIARDNAGDLPPASPSASQREHVMHTVAGFKHLGFQVVAARLALGVDTALAWRQLDTLVAKPTGDIFWMYPAVGFYFNLKSKLDSGWRARFRDSWKTYTPYRGDTENHFLMYYASILLMSQEWPGLDGSEWFNGKSSRENYDEAHEYLTHWIDETARLGSTEWDSPRYVYYYITPLVLLRDFTSDTLLRRRCEMMLELTLVDYAVEYLNGSYAGAHSRDGDGSVIDPRKAEATSYAQLFFTDSISFVLPDLAFAAMSTWTCPPIIRAIAHDRDSSYVHTELKRSRARMRNSTERFSKVYKYDYMTSAYCLGSIQGRVHQPIQQHTWDVTYASSKSNNTVFSLHPTWSADELGTFFPEEPELMIEGVARAKASYTNENKWIGGSQAEIVAQDINTLLAFYDIALDDTVQHFDVFLPLSADTLFRDTSGWYILRFGDALTAVRVVGLTLADSTQGSWRRLRVRVAPMKGPHNGVVVICGRLSETSLEEFMKNIRVEFTESEVAANRRPGVLPTPIVVRDGLGVEHRFLWQLTSDRRTFDVRADAPADNTLRARRRMLFNGPLLNSELGSGVIAFTYGTHQRVLDFTRTEIR